MMRPLGRWVWIGGLLAGRLLSAWAGDVAAPLPDRADPVQGASLKAACDGPAFQTVLRRVEAAAPSVQAEAYWLDRRQLQWPGVQAGGGTFWLLSSRQAALQVQVGSAPLGVDLALPLQAVPAAEAAALPPGFSFIGAGVRLVLRAADEASLPGLLRGQTELVQLDAAGRVLRATAAQTPGALDDRYAAAEDLALGAQPGAAATAFRLWAPTAQQVAVCLYPDAEGAADRVVPLQADAATGAWSLSLPGHLSGRYFRYLVDVFVPGVGLVRNRVTDPYSLSLSADSRRSYITGLTEAAVTPAGWREDRAPETVKAATDMVVYELHLRDFSASDVSVPAAERGKYLAFTQADSNGMRELAALARAGVTDVHLLPVFDFGSVPERGCVSPDPHGAPDGTTQQAAVRAAAGRDCFNWGYDPVHYSAPEGSYASDADDGAVRLREFRQMVMALHRTGLRVGMDVVYNHSFAAGQQEKSVLDRIVPGYYQRLDAQGRIEHSTCCDNTATEHRMMGKLLVDSVLTWARDQHVDSFRFDLMGHQPRAVMVQLQQRLKQALGHEVFLIGEGWNFGEVADGRRFVQASQGSLNGTGIGTFNDRGRDAARGGGAGDQGAAMVARQGWVNGLVYDPNGAAPTPSREALLRSADLLRATLAGSLRDYPLPTWTGQVRPLSAIDAAGQPAGYASEPAEVVNYVENHDNQTLFDTDAMKLPRGTSREDRARVQILAAALPAFSQGVAYFHGGVERLRSKSLDRNSYASGDWFNRIDWSGQTNHFGSGLPPEPDNGADWPLMRPLLADPSIAPTPATLAWTRAAFFDLLRIRASSALFHLRSAAEVQARLHFFNTGPAQEPTVLAARLDGRGLPGAGFAELVYLLNADTRAHQVIAPDLAGHAFVLHPVLRDGRAADARAAAARFDPRTGGFEVPPRTVTVFVVDR